MSKVTVTIEPEGDNDGRRYIFPTAEGLFNTDTESVEGWPYDRYFRVPVSRTTTLTLTERGSYTVETIPGRRSKVKAALDGKVKKSADPEALADDLLRVLK